MCSVAVYYQTPDISFLKKLEKVPYGTDVTVILSSLHTGVVDGESVLYLNDTLIPTTGELPPNLHELWDVCSSLYANEKASFSFMLGGAAGAYKLLFENYQDQFGRLTTLLCSTPWIGEIVLDIEEKVELIDVQKLVNDLYMFDPDMLISFSPLPSSLTTDEPGMGGFSYKKLKMSPVGWMVDTFYVQCYSDSFSLTTYEEIVANGYSHACISMGMTYSQTENLVPIIDTINGIHRHTDNPHVNVWDIALCKPTPIEWVEIMASVNPMDTLIDIKVGGNPEEEPEGNSEEEPEGDGSEVTDCMYDIANPNHHLHESLYARRTINPSESGGESSASDVCSPDEAAASLTVVGFAGVTLVVAGLIFYLLS
jgi:hypothetical protein